MDLIHMMLVREIESVWRNEIKNAFDIGILCSERQLQAEFYYYLKNKLKDHQLWIESTLELENEETKFKIIPDILITKENMIECIIELKYNPWHEVDVISDLNKMCQLEEYKRDKSFNLKIGSTKQQYGNDVFFIAKDILCVYGAIARGNFAYGVADRKFWAEKNYKVNIPKNFLHLVGRVFGNEDSIFMNADY